MAGTVRMTKTRTQLAVGGPVAWRSVDLVTTAILGVALGVAFWGWDLLLYPAVSALLNTAFPPLASLTLGVWVLPAVVGGVGARRPGAALFCEIVAAPVEALLGNQWGLNVMISGALQALGVEIVLAIFLWRGFRLWVAMLAGAFSAILELCCWEWWVYQGEYTLGMKLVALGCAVVSCSAISGAGGWGLVRAMAATGALNAFPAGREHLARRG